MDNAARARQRVLALFLPIAAVLYISAEALSPKGTDQVITTTATALKVLSIAAKHPAQLYAAGSLAILALGALAVSYAAIATLARNRGSAVATVAALIGDRRLLRGHRQRPGLSQSRRRRDGTSVSRRGRAVPGDNLQPWVRPRVLLRLFRRHLRRGGPHGYALWRSRSVPRWLAVLFFAGLEVAQAQISSGPVVILYMLPFAAAMVLLGARIWQAAALPASQPQSADPVPASSM